MTRIECPHCGMGVCDSYIADMSKALMPFAHAAQDCIDIDEPDSSDAWEHSCAMAVTIGDFRNARDIYAKRIPHYTQKLERLTEAALPFVRGFNHDPGQCDLDNEQPINVRVTLGDYRKLIRILNETA